MPKERLDKILSSQGLCSRREAGALIRRGLVSVNGAPAENPDRKFDPLLDEITVDGKKLVFRRFEYLMMNKPAGVLSASRDRREKTVLDLLPPELSRRGLFPAGRLDRDTEGLLILTDDGDYAHRMLSPKSHVYKIYHAVLDFPIEKDDIEAFACGVEMKDFNSLPAKLSILPKSEAPYLDMPPECFAAVEIREGKFHQVKRMFAARGKTVLALKRVRIGALRLDESLLPGRARRMAPSEVMAVFHGNEVGFL